MRIHDEYRVNQMRAKPRTFTSQTDTELRSLRNVGPTIAGYLVDLGIRSIETLAKQEADNLYRRLQRRIGKACDPCLHDTFSAIIHEARTGEKTPWFTWTAERKRRVAAGQLDLGLRGRERRA
jgi:hypothetical protein